MHAIETLARTYRDRVQTQNHEILYQMYGIATDEKCDNDHSTHIAMQQIVDKMHCALHDHGANAQPRTHDSPHTHASAHTHRFAQLYSDAENWFTFGKEMIYVSPFYDREMKTDARTDVVYVTANYTTLKAEVTSHQKWGLTMAQFMIESKKAAIHYRSSRRKKQHALLTEKHLLALLLYCNFDVLQYQLSRSYRENMDERQRNNFYHFGKLLKECVNVQNGTCIKDGDVTDFYHGIDKILVPTQFVGHLGRGISVFGPLSTSSSLIAATNFTRQNQGLVMVFGDEHKRSEARYISVEWISDFSSEREYLFLQNREPMQINNIIDCVGNFHCKAILHALKALDCILFDSHFYQLQSKQALTHEHAALIKLIVHMFAYRLNKTNAITHPYAKKLVDVYCEHKQRLTINHAVLKTKYRLADEDDIFTTICEADYSWIQIDTLSAIFPNIKHIEIEIDVLSAEILENVSKNRMIFQSGSGSWKLDKMRMKIPKDRSFDESTTTKLLSQHLPKWVDWNDTRIIVNRVDCNNDNFFIVDFL